MEQTIDFALLERVATKIENLPDPRLFDMGSTTGYFENECGTSHCIGGWICKETNAYPVTCITARDVAGLTNDQADYLFYPEASDGFGGWEATPEQGAAKIRKFIKDNQPVKDSLPIQKKRSLFERFFDWFENL